MPSSPRAWIRSPRLGMCWEVLGCSFPVRTYFDSTIIYIYMLCYTSFGICICVYIHMNEIWRVEPYALNFSVMVSQRKECRWSRHEAGTQGKCLWRMCSLAVCAQHWAAQRIKSQEPQSELTWRIVSGWLQCRGLRCPHYCSTQASLFAITSSIPEGNML